MKLMLIKDSWNAKGKTFYVVRYKRKRILDELGNFVRKGEPIIWLTEEQFDLIRF